MPSADAKTLAPQLTFNFAKISTVLPHFLGIRQIEVPLPLCFPSCRDVQQQDLRLHQASQLLHVRKQNGVSFAVVQRDENLFKHLRSFFSPLLSSCGHTTPSASKEQDQKIAVQHGDEEGRQPGETLQSSRAGEFSHFFPIAGELHQGEHSKRKLQAQYHLTQNQQLCRALTAIKSHHHNGRDNGQ